MKPTPTFLFPDLDDQGVAVGMDIDDSDPLDVFAAEGILENFKPADADFFNAFDDDFDDGDID